MQMHLKSDEITALLRQQQGALVETDGAGKGPSNCDVVYALFLEPHSKDGPPSSRVEATIERVIEAFTPTPSLVHVELLVPPIPDSGGRRVHFATYLSPPYRAEWQGGDVDESVDYYLVTNGARWRALPVFLPHAVDAVRAAADANVDAQYSLPRYATSAKPFRRLAWLLPDADRAPGHCATLTARVLRRSGATDAVPRCAAWYSPGSLYTTLVAHAGTRLTGADRQQMGSVAPDECTETLNTLLKGPLSYQTVRSVGDVRAIDAVRSLTLRVCNAAAAEDEVASRIAQKDLAQALLRWALLRDDGARPLGEGQGVEG
jgi:hypothetical protein